MYDFDILTDRRGTDSIKLEMMAEMFGRTDLLPMWVADMEFRTPDFILEALQKRIEHPIMGYTGLPQGYFDTVSSWVEKLHGWKVPACCFSFIPGIVKGIGFAVDCFLKPGEKVIIQTPVYHPFRLVPQRKGYEVLFNALQPVYEDGAGRLDNMLTVDRDRRLTGYSIDFENLEKLIDKDTRMLILCNPHNPAGICWDRKTLEKVAEITSRHGMIVVSDEIHAEMALGENRHIPYASVCETAAANSITFMAPSKTFNIAGIVSSYAIVPDPELRKRFFDWLEAGELDFAPLFSTVATMAAYRNGWQWRREMLDYVQANVEYADSWLKGNLPQIRCVRPQASFLVWLDCRSLGLSQEKLVDLFVNRARLALNDGAMFGSMHTDGSHGPEGQGFMRLNVGCPRSMLQEALERLRAAVMG